MAQGQIQQFASRFVARCRATLLALGRGGLEIGLIAAVSGLRSFQLAGFSELRIRCAMQVWIWAAG